MGPTEVPVDLLEAFDRRGSGVVAFVGSGPSCDAGLPSWSELLHRVAAEIELDGEIEATLRRGDFLAAAHFLARQRTERDIQERIAKQIKRAARGPGTIHELIVKLPFAGIITTNYDLLLTEADVSRNFSLPITYLNSSLRGKFRERFLLHLHGHVDDPASIVITRQGYDDIQLKENQVRQFLSSVFQARSVLFIGFGFADDHIDNLLRDLQESGAIGESSVFGLVPSALPPAHDRVRHENLRFRLINPIYVNDTGDYGVKHLCEWMQNLSKALDKIRLSQDRSVRSVKPAYLVNRLETLLASEQWLPAVTKAINALPDRPDLHHLVRASLKRTDVIELLDQIGLDEMRSILLIMNGSKRDPLIEDALTCFPASPRERVEVSGSSVTKDAGAIRESEIVVSAAPTVDTKPYLDKNADRIMAISELHLGKFRVVGNYLRFEDESRSKLQDLFISIKRGLELKTTKRENYLIWGPPGTGKTYFLTEIVRSMDEAFALDNFRMINLRTIEKPALASEIDQLSAGRPSPVLCMFDEIDGPSADSLPYELLLSSLDLNTWENRHIVFVLAGSGHGGLAEMTEAIKARPKGVDLISRIPDYNRFELPKPVVEDRVLLFAQQVLLACKAKQLAISEIERLALYFVLQTDALSSARQLSELAKSSVEKMSPTDGRLFYDHLFKVGDRQFIRFWEENRESATRLEGTFITVEE